MATLEEIEKSVEDAHHAIEEIVERLEGTDGGEDAVEVPVRDLAEWRHLAVEIENELVRENPAMAVTRTTALRERIEGAL